MARYSAPKGHTNKRMNENVYKERREVIDLIYRAKKLLRSVGIEIPRIDVRITAVEPEVTAIGVAQMKGRYIWIPEHSLGKSHLYTTVLHELCHAVWGIGHDKSCKLMHPNLQPDLTDKRAEELFINYAKKHNKL